MPDLIDICMCSDFNYLKPTVVAINSLLSNTKYNNNFIRINILCDNFKTKDELENLLKKIKTKFPKIILRNSLFIASIKLKELIKKITINKKSKKLGCYKINTNISNYSRFYFKEHFSDLGRIIYLDSDILVLGDIYNLYKLHDSKLSRKKYINSYFIAYDRKRDNSTYYNWNHKGLIEYKDVLKKKGTYFNAGIYLTDLNNWVKNDIVNKIEKCIENNVTDENTVMYLSGTEPPLNIIFHDAGKLDKIWNYTPKKKEDPENVCKNAKILHFKGPLKPWLNNGNRMSSNYGKRWRFYLK